MHLPTSARQTAMPRQEQRRRRFPTNGSTCRLIAKIENDWLRNLRFEVEVSVGDIVPWAYRALLA